MAESEKRLALKQNDAADLEAIERAKVIELLSKEDFNTVLES